MLTDDQVRVLRDREHLAGQIHFNARVLRRYRRVDDEVRIDGRVCATRQHLSTLAKMKHTRAKVGI